jgi:hypothetical protein
LAKQAYSIILYSPSWPNRLILIILYSPSWPNRLILFFIYWSVAGDGAMEREAW